MITSDLRMESSKKEQAQRGLYLSRVIREGVPTAESQVLDI